MIAVLIYVTEVIRRALRKFGRGASILVESFNEAMEIRRSLPRHYVEE